MRSGDGSGRRPGPDSFRARLWSAVGRVGRELGEGEHEQIVAGLVLLRVLNVCFERAHQRLSRSLGRGGDPLLLEERGRYDPHLAWVPPRSRWPALESASTRAQVGRAVDIAIAGVEQANPSLRSTFPSDYARPELSSDALGALIRVLGEVPGRAGVDAAAELARVVHEFCGGPRTGERPRSRRHHRLLAQLFELLPAPTGAKGARPQPAPASSGARSKAPAEAPVKARSEAPVKPLPASSAQAPARAAPPRRGAERPPRKKAQARRSPRGGRGSSTVPP